MPHLNAMTKLFTASLHDFVSITASSSVTLINTRFSASNPKLCVRAVLLFVSAITNEISDLCHSDLVVADCRTCATGSANAGMARFQQGTVNSGERWRWGWGRTCVRP